jgi:hypothetical protein
MKIKLLSTSLFLLTFLNSGICQITITNQDLPSAGDTFRVSIGVIDPIIDPVPSGAAFTWDFSMLQYTNQDIDTFVTVGSTGITYSFVFADVAFNNNRANQATKGMFNLPPIPLGTITVSDVVAFYYKSTTEYRQSGYGAAINGIGVPIPFTNKDRIFELPMNYGNSHISNSDFQLTIPNLGYYGHDQVRESEVDGWGTLITPYGTFDVLRVKALITPHDSIFADTLGFGFGFDLAQTIEYKWMGAVQGIPLLQINTTLDPFGGETVTSIRYRDSLRTTGIGENPIDIGASVNLFPNPSNGQFTLAINTPVSEHAEATLFSIEGKKIVTLWKGESGQGLNKINFNCNAVSLALGTYFVEVKIGDKLLYKRLVIAAK